MAFRKPELIPLVFIIVATLTLGGLGAWQVQRLQWKNSMVAGIEAAQRQPALTQLPADANGLIYRNVVLKGTFLNDRQFRFVGQKQDAAMGFFIITPFKTDDGRVILVNRGWAPEGKESKPDGVQEVRGIIRPLREKRMFSPTNRPDKNIWFYEDMPLMARAVGSDLPPWLVEAVGKPERGVYPIPNDGTIGLRNDHLGYAITWFSLMVIGLVMFGASLRQPLVKTV